MSVPVSTGPVSAGSVPASWFSVPTPLPSGAVRVGITDGGVVGMTFGDGVGADGGRADAVRAGDEEKAALVAARLGEYFAGRRQAFDLPIDWRATAAGPQRSVLQTLQRTVRYGQTIAYGQLAARSGVFDDVLDQGGLAARAVGQIMGSNPLFLLVPCHRVVAADGIGGFGGGALGMEVKRWLLTLEGVLAPTLDWGGPG
ncbi:methylated-DNA--[protein]-cysteine S-methyltransferase [Streptacidiphilus carbonis]|uniref:methylated-DNA--[protein]-cysteine S-methyltransferase n=1 Tax=Streptacidiphilus carbonis TaxID=105422 RepID=UPI000694E440|nr:methylated-DNA--[protein]-cysteine S-methyltransferase [Streptacidiphilus carbonis]